MNGVDSNIKEESAIPFRRWKPSNPGRTSTVTLFEMFTKKELENFGIEVLNLLSEV